MYTTKPGNKNLSGYDPVAEIANVSCSTRSAEGITAFKGFLAGLISNGGTDSLQENFTRPSGMVNRSCRMRGQN